MKHLSFIMVAVLFFISCGSGNMTTAEAGYYYTCSMHPQIHENHPGLCPVCHMDLIKVKVTQSAADEIVLNEDQIRLGNITVDTISTDEIGDRQILTALLSADESSIEVVPARINGRIEKMYFKSVGDYVAKGQPVFSLYSEELNNAKQELAALVEKRKTLDNSIIDFDQLIEATRQKLLLLGMSHGQINEFIRTGKSETITTFFSPVSGYVLELPFEEGAYVATGSPVLRIADFSRLWVEVQVYAAQASSISEGAVVEIEFPDLPGLRMSGSVSFVGPEVLPASRLTLARVEIANPEGKLRPGMAAYVIHRPYTKNVLTLPVDAVIRDGEQSVVWLQKDSTTFGYRVVQTGSESNHRIAITAGLDEGDRVVVSGVYLLNSEYLLKKGG